MSVVGIGECEEVMSSMFLVQRREKLESQMKVCVAKQKVGLGDWQINAWTLQTL